MPVSSLTVVLSSAFTRTFARAGGRRGGVRRRRPDVETIFGSSRSRCSSRPLPSACSSGPRERAVRRLETPPCGSSSTTRSRAGRRPPSLRRRQPIRQGGFPNERTRKPVASSRCCCVAVTAPSLRVSNARKGYERASRSLPARAHGGRPGLADQREGRAGERRGLQHPVRLLPPMPYKGRHSTVPSTAVCMNCTRASASTRNGPQDEGLLDRGSRFRDQVHDMPDFVYYDHSRT